MCNRLMHSLNIKNNIFIHTTDNRTGYPDAQADANCKKCQKNDVHRVLLPIHQHWPHRCHQKILINLWSEITELVERKTELLNIRKR